MEICLSLAAICFDPFLLDFFDFYGGFFGLSGFLYLPILTFIFKFDGGKWFYIITILWLGDVCG
jgi:hypothetical protein